MKEPYEHRSKQSLTRDSSFLYNIATLGWPIKRCAFKLQRFPHYKTDVKYISESLGGK